jgi:hypothetical protein
MQPYIQNSPLQNTQDWMPYFKKILEEIFQVNVFYQKPNYSTRRSWDHPFFQTSSPIQIPFLGISDKIVIFPKGFDVLDKKLTNQNFPCLVITPQLCRMLDNIGILSVDQYTEKPVRTNSGKITYVCESERLVGQWLTLQGIKFYYNPKLPVKSRWPNAHKTVDFLFPNPVYLSSSHTNQTPGLAKMVEVKGGPVKPQDLDRAYQILAHHEGPYCFIYWEFIRGLQNTF